MNLYESVKKNLKLKEASILDPDLNDEQVQADVDYWTDVDNTNTEDVSNREPIGSFVLSNTGAILVYEIDEQEDKVLAGDTSDRTKAKWRGINYYDLIDEETGDSIPFFYYNSIKVPFNEIMRLN